MENRLKVCCWSFIAATGDHHATPSFGAFKTGLDTLEEVGIHPRGYQRRQSGNLA